MRRLPCAAVAAGLLCIAALPAVATPPIDEPPPAPRGFATTDVVLGPRLIFRIRGAGDGETDAARAEQVRTRLLAALDSDAALIDAAAPGRAPSSEAVTVAREAPGAPPALYVYGTPVVTVDAALVRANRAASPEALAAKWADRLRDALTSAKERGTMLDPQRAVAGLPPSQQAPRVLPPPRVAREGRRP